MRGYARYCLERTKRENELQNIDRSRWYKINRGCIHNVELSSKFVENYCDSETSEFIQTCVDGGFQSFVNTFFKSLIRAVLNLFLTSTSICGLLKCGSMFVFSNEQFRSFVVETITAEHPDLNDDSLRDDGGNTFGQVLDIGAGDGTVTEVISKHFKRTFCTEISTYMCQRLQERGFIVLDVNDWANEFQAQITNDVTLVSCLNVLDRSVSLSYCYLHHS